MGSCNYRWTQRLVVVEGDAVDVVWTDVARPGLVQRLQSCRQNRKTAREEIEERAEDEEEEGVLDNKVGRRW